MVPFKIGNWNITEDAIQWDNQDYGREYEIPKSRVCETGTGSRSNMDDWLIHISEKTWITVADAYALNAAILYALNVWGLSYPTNISYVDTIIELEDILNEKR